MDGCRSRGCYLCGNRNVLVMIRRMACLLAVAGSLISSSAAHAQGGITPDYGPAGVTNSAPACERGTQEVGWIKVSDRDWLVSKPWRCRKSSGLDNPFEERSNPYLVFFSRLFLALSIVGSIFYYQRNRRKSMWLVGAGLVVFSGFFGLTWLL